MSTVVVVAPLVIANWSAITAAVTAAIGTLGYSLANVRRDTVRTGVADAKTRTEIDVEDSEILEEATGTGEEIVVEKEGVKAVFRRDAKGALKVCMEGHGYSKGELRRIGEDLLGRVTQQYVYHKMITELKEKNMTVVNEEVAEDRTIRIQVRVH